MLRHAVGYKFTDVLEVLAVLIIRVMTVVSTSEMSASFCQNTRHNIPEGVYLHGLGIID
jgi:hypothetical protein